MIQDVIVMLIGLIVLAILAYKVYAFFFIKKENGACGYSSCHCSSSKKKK